MKQLLFHSGLSLVNLFINFLFFISKPGKVNSIDQASPSYQPYLAVIGYKSILVQTLMKTNLPTIT